MVLNQSITSNPQFIHKVHKIRVSSISPIKIDKVQTTNTRGTRSSPTSIGLLLEASKKVGVQSPHSFNIFPNRRFLIAQVPLDPYLLDVLTS